MRQDVLLLSDDPDLYYKWLKPKGGMDWIKDIVKPEEETGIFIDEAIIWTPTIQTDRIVIENLNTLISRVKMFI